MKPTRALAAGLAAMTISITAPTGTLGGTAQAAEPATAVRSATVPSSTGVTWHKLTLLNGWHPAQETPGTGTPSWAVKNGIVYLSGGLTQPVAGPDQFATLPAAARPADARSSDRLVSFSIDSSRVRSSRFCGYAIGSLRSNWISSLVIGFAAPPSLAWIQ